MSWVDAVQTEFSITTGDGEEYKVLWQNATKSVDFNIAEFEFPNLAGTLVQRGTPKGRRFNLEVYFQGEDTIEKSLAFEQSANDPRPWTMIHPFYGTIIAHPVSLLFDNSRYNVSKITGTLIETITQDNPKNVIVPADKIKQDHENLKVTFAESFVTDIPEPDTSDINTMTENTQSVYDQVKNKIANSVDAEEYFNAYNDANTAILDATDAPLEAITKVQDIINSPYQFTDSVVNRVNMLVSQFNRLRESVETIVGKNDKKIYENNAGVTISALAAASITLPDYTNRNDVVRIIDEITDAYDAYIEDIDGLQSDNGGDPESYVPDSTSLRALNDIVNFTISNLYDIALNSKQERAVILEEDSNVILLAHRFYGLQSDDSTIDQIINNNDIGLNELLGVRKGRRIIYYV
jgi:hypothetical protein